jgi:hypothetical protein
LSAPSRVLSQPLDPITDVLARIGRKGIKLWAANGELHYRAAKGALTENEIDTLRRHKEKIVSMLEGAENIALADPTVASPSGSDLAVLSFSQELHWRRYKLDSEPASRAVASATRLVGPIDFVLFRESMSKVVRRHPGLRTRIVIRDGVPMQKISESLEYKLELRELTALAPPSRETEVKRLIEHLILQPIRVTEGPLWEAHLLRLHSEEHVLLVVMEHIISDMRSLQILLRDILSTYMQLSRGGRLFLPAIPVQFAEYAEWQRKLCDSHEVRSSYWTKRLSGCPRVRFPDDRALQRQTQLGWDHVSIKITSQRRESLLAWSRSGKTTISMAMFAAYAALLSRWCDVSDSVIHYTIDGRTTDKVRHTIGYFAKLLPIRVELYRTDSFVTLLRRVTEEYCRAYEQSDFYKLDAEIPEPDFVSNSHFNWIMLDNGTPGSENAADGTVRYSPIPFEPPISSTVEVDVEPFVMLFDVNREVSGGIYFQKDRFSFERMRRFVLNFNIFIEALLERPEASIYDIPLV